jgi:hypothetical protein
VFVRVAGIEHGVCASCGEEYLSMAAAAKLEEEVRQVLETQHIE